LLLLVFLPLLLFVPLLLGGKALLLFLPLLLGGKALLLFLPLLLGGKALLLFRSDDNLPRLFLSDDLPLTAQHIQQILTPFYDVYQLIQILLILVSTQILVINLSN